MSDKISIIEYLDLNNVEHLRALQYYYKSGQWPQGFGHENIVYPPNWTVHISFILAGKYVDSKLIDLHINGNFKDRVIENIKEVQQVLDGPIHLDPGINE